MHHFEYIVLSPAAPPAPRILQLVGLRPPRTDNQMYKRTGLTVTIGKAESPIVNGYFCLATEAKTRDGLPHTLEHLIFLGRLVDSYT